MSIPTFSCIPTSLRGPSPKASVTIHKVSANWGPLCLPPVLQNIWILFAHLPSPTMISHKRRAKSQAGMYSRDGYTLPGFMRMPEHTGDGEMVDKDN